MRCAVVSLNVCVLASGLTNARLPQVVVVGAQSAGKSALVEALMGPRAGVRPSPPRV